MLKGVRGTASQIVLANDSPVPGRARVRRYLQEALLEWGRTRARSSPAA